jgi:hypothetical protein
MVVTEVATELAWLIRIVRRLRDWCLNDDCEVLYDNVTHSRRQNLNIDHVWSAVVVLRAVQTADRAICSLDRNALTGANEERPRFRDYVFAPSGRVWQNAEGYRKGGDQYLISISDLMRVGVAFQGISLAGSRFAAQAAMT